MGPRSADRGNPQRLVSNLDAYAASMGPRSADRGNSSPVGAASTAAQLQWGRDQQIAEIGLGGRHRHLLRRFNGAAISRSRKCGRRLSARRNGHRFNGAAISRSRK